MILMSHPRNDRPDLESRRLLKVSVREGRVQECGSGQRAHLPKHAQPEERVSIWERGQGDLEVKAEKWQNENKMKA